MPSYTPSNCRRRQLASRSPIRYQDILPRPTSTTVRSAPTYSSPYVAPTQPPAYGQYPHTPADNDNPPRYTPHPTPTPPGQEYESHRAAPQYVLPPPYTDVGACACQPLAPAPTPQYGRLDPDPQTPQPLHQNAASYPSLAPAPHSQYGPADPSAAPALSAVDPSERRRYEARREREAELYREEAA